MASPRPWKTMGRLKKEAEEREQEPSLMRALRTTRLAKALGFDISTHGHLFPYPLDPFAARDATKEEVALWEAILALPEQAFERAVQVATKRRQSQEGGGGAEDLPGGGAEEGGGEV